ncbi:MAG: hydroxymethylglutaryl-CoA lyase [Planctomycetes bacterium]|nr:hydroxymethylglutaryl-CoA lyase [Planctomycetota bacterium]
MIRIVEVGPRDGLQNERRTIPTAVKIAFVNALSHARLSEIEVSAFVSSKAIPQLADADEVCTRIGRAPGVVYSALVPNERGLGRALAARIDKVAVFTAASETFNRKNIHASIAESFVRFAPVLAGARRAGKLVRGYLSTAFWCPYEGKIAPAVAADLVTRLFDAGVDEVSIGDTIGKAAPDEVMALLDLVLPRHGAARLALHFHDTFGRAVANALAAWRRGVETFDASAGGIGGCPYALGATGNVATEALVTALVGAGAKVGVDLEKLLAARETIRAAIRALP